MNPRARGGLTIHGDLLAIGDIGADLKDASDDRIVIAELTPTGMRERWSVKWDHAGRWDYSQYLSPLFIKNRVILGGRNFTDAFDVVSGEMVGRVKRISVANCGHLSGVNDTIIAQPDGKHGVKAMTFFRLTDYGGLASIGPANDRWAHAHPQTTTYGTLGRNPLVDGRWFIKGGDAIYCYDLRAP